MSVAAYARVLRRVFFDCNQSLRFERVLFEIRQKISKHGIKKKTFVEKNRASLLMQGSFPERVLSIESKISDLRKYFLRKRKKNQNRCKKNSPTDFFEGCRKWTELKRDYVIMQAHEGLDGNSIRITFLKIG